MGVIRFYHLSHSPVDAVAAQLVARAYAAGLRVEVRGRDAARLDALDRALWLGDDAGFLPHGRAGGPHDARQPILLTEADAAAPETACVLALDGAPVDAAEAARLDRSFIVFDGEDPVSRDHARGQWQNLKDAGADLEYWSEVSGKWERRA